MLLCVSTATSKERQELLSQHGTCKLHRRLSIPPASIEHYEESWNAPGVCPTCDDKWQGIQHTGVLKAPMTQKSCQQGSLSSPQLPCCAELCHVLAVQVSATWSSKTTLWIQPTNLVEALSQHGWPAKVRQPSFRHRKPRQWALPIFANPIAAT